MVVGQLAPELLLPRIARVILAGTGQAGQEVRRTTPSWTQREVLPKRWAMNGKDEGGLENRKRLAMHGVDQTPKFWTLLRGIRRHGNLP